MRRSCGKGGLALGGRTLQRGGEANCIDNALKLDKHAVAGGLDKATAIAGICGSIASRRRERRRARVFFSSSSPTSRL